MFEGVGWWIRSTEAGPDVGLALGGHTVAAGRTPGPGGWGEPLSNANSSGTDDAVAGVDVLRVRDSLVAEKFSYVKG